MLSGWYSFLGERTSSLPAARWKFEKTNRVLVAAGWGVLLVSSVVFRESVIGGERYR
jgi:hypothetical protein